MDLDGVMEFVLTSGLDFKLRNGKLSIYLDKLPAPARGNGRQFPRAECARRWLVERFREKLEWQSDDLFARAKEDGISRSAVFEAKKLVELPPARRTAGPGGAAAYVWWVPKDWPHLQEEAAKEEGTPQDGIF